MMFVALIRNVLTVIAVVGVSMSGAPTFAEVYELRTYTTNEGKLDDMNARFRDHTVRLFKKHGMESVGYWTPTAEPKSANTLIYVLKHESRAAAKASWAAFLADPEWKQVAADSQKDGKILAAPPDSVFMDAAEYSPKFANGEPNGDTVFELRIYRCDEGRLKNLDARFRDHTIRIFERHGMQSVAYWHPSDEPASKDTLIYILKHKSSAAAQASWKAFGGDDEWKKVAAESQRDGRILREKPEAIYLKATDYSAIR